MPSIIQLPIAELLITGDVLVFMNERSNENWSYPITDYSPRVAGGLGTVSLLMGTVSHAFSYAFINEQISRHQYNQVYINGIEAKQWFGETLPIRQSGIYKTYTQILKPKPR